jgi:hypothetical protein
MSDEEEPLRLWVVIVIVCVVTVMLIGVGLLMCCVYHKYQEEIKEKKMAALERQEKDRLLQR